MTGDGAERRIAAMRRHFPEAEVSGYRHLIPDLTNDPKDRHVLAAAIKAEAEFIVTANLRDFSADALDEHAIEAVHPDDFLCDLFDTDPELLRQNHAAHGDAVRPSGFELIRLVILGHQ